MTSTLYAAFCSTSSSSSSSSSLPSSLCPPRISKCQSSSSSCYRVMCRAGSQPLYTASELKLVLHDAMESAGINTAYAREAREGFCSQIKYLSDIERETSISINRRVDLGRTALHIAAEDDSLISHSSVPLPVDAFIDRLDELSVGFCPHYNSSLCSTPEGFLESIERYLFDKKGFRRANVRNPLEQRALYLHSVLMHRSGSAVMLSLIYSEILKMLRLWGLVDFDVEISFPEDVRGLPRGYNKQKSKESDVPHIMTVQALLEEILRNLKSAFWPFQHNRLQSLFLRAAHAANCIDGTTIEDSGLRLASAKAAQHRLERGVWTSVRFGDMRRALSACERLILLETNANELRDYSILLYHCGYYLESLHYLKMYQALKSASQEKTSSDPVSRMEEDAVEKLMVRLNLILMEEGWNQPAELRNFLRNNSEPW